jgi:hypothetical protein
MTDVPGASREETHDPMEAELRRARDGRNPMFGNWRQRFAFEPVPRTAPAEVRRAFGRRVRSEIGTQYSFSSDVRLEITLYLDLQTVRETSETADLDNYAKSICDAPKGSDGIVLDDCQVQCLTILWIDHSYVGFDVEMRSGDPDAFVLKSVESYEMPDGLYYPTSRNAWYQSGVSMPPERDHYTWIRRGSTMLSISRPPMTDTISAASMRMATTVRAPTSVQCQGP